MKNLVKRGNVYYLRKQVDGRRVFQSLKTGDLVVAKARCAPLVKAAYSARFAPLLESVQSKRLVATLGEVFAVYRLEARSRGLDDRTVGSYVSQLSNILRKVHGADLNVEKASTTLLTADLLNKYTKQEFLAAGADRLKQERAKGTIRSTIINARAVFAKWTDSNGIYAGLALPDLTEFKKIGVPWKSEPHIYRRPPEGLIARTIAAGRALRETDPRLYVVFLLCYDLALRAGEAMAIRRDWFTAHTGAEGKTIMHADIFRRADFKPKWGMERSVPLNADTWRELQGLWEKQLSLYVLPGNSETERYDLVKREFAAWMRGLGWDVGTYPKAAHELRKLMGSEWFTKKTPQFAQEKLGHRSIATTCTYYARLASKPEALEREVMKEKVA